MSTRVLKAFLLGIGWDTSNLEQGNKKITESLSNVRASSLGVSAAMLGAFAGVAANVAATANRVDNLAASSQNLRTGINTVYGFGNAIRLMGGEASEAVDTLKNFEEIQNNLRLKGQAGPLNDLRLAGIDTTKLSQTQTGEEFMRVLSDMLPGLDKGQRAVVQGTLGLSDATFRTLVNGFDSLSFAMDKADNLTGHIDGLVDNSRRFKEATATLSLSVEGVTNELADKFLPSLTGFSDWASGWISEHRTDISGAIDTLSNNAGATATAGTSAAATLVGSLLQRLGLSTVGGAISKTGTVGLAVSGGALGASALNQSLDSNFPLYRSASRGFDDMLKGITGLDRIPGPSELLFGGYSASGSQPVSAPVHAEDDGVVRLPAQNMDALAAAIQRAKLNVQLGVQLDGRAIEAKIVEVNQRQNYDSMNEIQSSTER